MCACVCVFLEFLWEEPLSNQALMFSAGPGHPPGVLASHDHGRAAPQSHRHGKSSFCSFCILMTFFFHMALPLNSKSRLQPASLRSPLMFFSLVNYASAFPQIQSLAFCPPLWLSLMFCVFFFKFSPPVAARHLGRPVVAPGSRPSLPSPLGAILCNSQNSHRGFGPL